MPFEQRIQHPSFVDNNKEIEANWSKEFGDRNNEIVFIGLGLDQDEIEKTLEKCLMSEEELAGLNWKKGFEDDWPVERVYAL